MSRWMPYLGLLGRLVVGGVWLYAGVLKVGDPSASVGAVRSYQLLSADVAEVVGRSLPTLEIVLGLALVLGLLTRISGLLSGLLQIAFVIGIVSVWSRGIAIDCGCFGDGGPDPDAFSKYPWEIARDLGLLAVSAFLVAKPRTAFGLDAVLFPDPPADPPATTQEQVTDVEV